MRTRWWILGTLCATLAIATEGRAATARTTNFVVEAPTQELAQEFVYPGAKKFGEDREGARMYQAKFTTPDDAGNVAGWYRKTLKFQGGEGISFNPGNQPGIRESVVDDSRQPDESRQGASRPHRGVRDLGIRAVHASGRVLDRGQVRRD